MYCVNMKDIYTVEDCIFYKAAADFGADKTKGKSVMAKCTKGGCCFHLRYTNSITMLTTKEN